MLRWTAEELKKIIAMLRNPEFDSKDVDPDLHKRMEKAVEDGRIRCFNMREGPADGDQDLNFWSRELEDVVREIMEDPVFKGNQHYKFEMDLEEAGKRLFGGEANAGSEASADVETGCWRRRASKRGLGSKRIIGMLVLKQLLVIGQLFLRLVMMHVREMVRPNMVSMEISMT